MKGTDSQSIKPGEEGAKERLARTSYIGSWNIRFLRDDNL